MSNYLNVLMVGGIRDGDRMQVTPDTKSIRVVVPPSDFAVNMRQKVECAPTFQEIEYRIVMVAGACAVAVEAGISSEMAFAMLLEGYRPEVQR